MYIQDGPKLRERLFNGTCLASFARQSRCIRGKRSANLRRKRCFLIRYILLYFVLLTRISNKLLKAVAIHVEPCLAQEILGHSLQLTFRDFILEGLQGTWAVTIQVFLQFSPLANITHTEIWGTRQQQSAANSTLSPKISRSTVMCVCAVALTSWKYECCFSSSVRI